MTFETLNVDELAPNALVETASKVNATYYVEHGGNFDCMPERPTKLAIRFHKASENHEFVRIRVQYFIS